MFDDFFSQFDVSKRGYMWGYIKITKNEAKKVNKNNALVAQLDRALDYESRGQGFESSRAHHIYLNQKCLPFITILVIL